MTTPIVTISREPAEEIPDAVIRSALKAVGDEPFEASTYEGMRLSLKAAFLTMAQIKQSPNPALAGELPEFSEADRKFLSDNPNTDDLIDWVQEYACAAIAQSKAPAGKLPPIPEEDRRIKAGHTHELEDIVQRKQTPAADVYQYFHQTGPCYADSGTSPDCICWHDEGTGPNSTAARAENPRLDWRLKPKPAQSTADMCELGVIPAKGSLLPQAPAGELPPLLEPVAYGCRDTMIGCGNRLMIVRLDKGQDGCTEPLYTADQLRNVLEQAINCYSPDDTALDWVDKIRKLQDGYLI